MVCFPPHTIPQWHSEGKCHHRKMAVAVALYCLMMTFTFPNEQGVFCIFNFSLPVCSIHYNIKVLRWSRCSIWGGGDSYLTFLATWSASLLHLLSTRNDSKGPVMTSSLKVIGETCTSMIVHTLRDVPTSHSLPRAAEQRQLLWSWTLLDAC